MSRRSGTIAVGASKRHTALFALPLVVAIVGVITAGAPGARAQSVDALVTVGSPATTTPQNSQNEPAVAVAADRPSVLAAGANDLVDMQPCDQQAATTAGACSFPLGTFNLGVGLTGDYFSFDSGHTWVQPAYQGLTAAGCDPTSTCTPQTGPIHTVPNYYESGLRSRGDPGVAFGPAPGAHGFSWNNGDRLYLSTLATNLTDSRIQFKGQNNGQNSTFAVTVSYIDNVTADRVVDQSNWSRPAFAAPHAAESAGLDKEQVWADNAATSAFFGNVYVCYVDFHSFSRGNAAPLFAMVSTSSDGGVTWHQHAVAPPANNGPQGAYDGCTVRTDSHGVVYAFFTHFSNTSLNGFHSLIKSFDGGQTWSQPQDVVAFTDPCFAVDPVSHRCVEDGIAGARTDLAAMPSVDIANGAPSGTDATNEILDAWSDGRLGQNNEKTMISYSSDGGTTWSAPAAISLSGDRSMYSAPALAPDGTTAYVVYNANEQPFQTTTAAPRLEHGVLLASPIGAGGAPTGWASVYSGPPGDARGTSQGRILYNEFLGDYVYAAATRTYGVGVWTDARRAADCSAMDAWRQQSHDAGHPVFPAPWPLADCPDAFGNNDIFSATTG
jgi:hypothetical protein